MLLTGPSEGSRSFEVGRSGPFWPVDSYGGGVASFVPCWWSAAVTRGARRCCPRKCYPHHAGVMYLLVRPFALSFLWEFLESRPSLIYLGPRLGATDFLQQAAQSVNSVTSRAT